MKHIICGCCNIFTFSKIFTVTEILLNVIFLIGWTLFYYFFVNTQYNAAYNDYKPLVYEISSWNETIVAILCAVCISTVVILFLEYHGVHAKKLGFVVFSCVFRCIQVLGMVGLLIYLVVLIAQLEEETETTSTSLK